MGHWPSSAGGAACAASPMAASADANSMNLRQGFDFIAWPPVQFCYQYDMYIAFLQMLTHG
ncbi:hypothetical protein GCM10027318_03890 [Massilia agilis]